MDLLAIRSGFRYVIEAWLPFLVAIFSAWAVGWIRPDGLLIWPAIIGICAGGFLVQFDVALLPGSESYRFTVAVTLLQRSVMATLVCIVALLLDRVPNDFLLTAVNFGVLMFLLTTIGTIVTIWVAMLTRFRRLPLKIAIVAVTESSISFARQIKQQQFLALEMVGFMEDRTPDRIPDHSPDSIVCRMDQARQYLEKHPVDHVLISLPLLAGIRFGQVMEQLLDSTCSVHYLHDFLIFKPIRQAITPIGKMTVFTIIDAPSSGWGSMFKRVFDFCAALTSLIALSPLLLVVAVWIKLDSEGPVMFSQNRWGGDGKSFKIYKFRSMTQAASSSQVVAQAKKGDMRVTKVGAFIRRTSIDELPQLLNILIGNMSLVGPRPHAIAHNEEYRGLVKGYMLRHKVKPGLTGWAQIHGFRGETDTLDKMEGRIEYDLEYLRNWTPSLDLYIIYRTIGLVLRRTNAY